MDDVTPVVAALKKSGFPLQTRVQHEIQKRVSEWTLATVEHPWRDPDGKDQFVDLMAYCGGVVLVIECKKAQDRSLLFLRPLGPDTTGLVESVSAWRAEKKTGASTPWGIALAGIELEPASYRAQFCVVSDTGGQRLLEQDARLVALAAEAVAQDFVGIRGTSRVSHLLPTRSFLVPVIVTTASLYTLRFQPTEVDLETGDFSNLDPKQILPIPWVRFHKTLTASGPEERTVLVVNARALPTFLDEVARGRNLA